MGDLLVLYHVTLGSRERTKQPSPKLTRPPGSSVATAHALRLSFQWRNGNTNLGTTNPSRQVSVTATVETFLQPPSLKGQSVNAMLAIKFLC